MCNVGNIIMVCDVTGVVELIDWDVVGLTWEPYDLSVHFTRDPEGSLRGVWIVNVKCPIHFNL